MAFNWARATLGTIPFVTIGARYGGVQGGLMGFALGCALFGLIAVATAYAATWRLAKAIDGWELGPAAASARGRVHGNALAIWVKLALNWVPAAPTAVTITSATPEPMSAYSIAVTPWRQSMNRRNSLVMASVPRIPPHQA